MRSDIRLSEGRFELLKIYNANSGEITETLIRWSIACMLWIHIKCSHKGRKDPKEEKKKEWISNSIVLKLVVTHLTISIIILYVNLLTAFSEKTDIVRINTRLHCLWSIKNIL